MKQETLEETAKEFFRKFKHTHIPDSYYLALVEFSKLQQERSYSEEEVIAFGEFIFKHSLLTHTKGVKSLFEQFKKK